MTPRLQNIFIWQSLISIAPPRDPYDDEDEEEDDKADEDREPLVTREPDEENSSDALALLDILHHDYEENSLSIDDHRPCNIGLLRLDSWNDGSLGMAHIVGLGASVLILVLIWFWPTPNSRRSLHLEFPTSKVPIWRIGAIIAVHCVGNGTSG